MRAKHPSNSDTVYGCGASPPITPSPPRYRTDRSGSVPRAFDARVPKGRVFVPAERKHGLIHLFGVEHLQPHEQMEVLLRQAGDGQEQVRLQLGKLVLLL